MPASLAYGFVRAVDGFCRRAGGRRQEARRLSVAAFFGSHRCAARRSQGAPRAIGNDAQAHLRLLGPRALGHHRMLHRAGSGQLARWGHARWRRRQDSRRGWRDDFRVAPLSQRVRRQGNGLFCSRYRGAAARGRARLLPADVRECRATVVRRGHGRDGPVLAGGKLGSQLPPRRFRAHSKSAAQADDARDSGHQSPSGRYVGKLRMALGSLPLARQQPQLQGGVSPARCGPALGASGVV